MPVTFGAPPGPAGGGAGAGPGAPAPSSPTRGHKAHPPGVKEILKTVTPNYVVTAVIKNRLEEGKIKAQKKKRRTRQEILATMDLRELQVWLFVCLLFWYLSRALVPHPLPRFEKCKGESTNLQMAEERCMSGSRHPITSLRCIQT